MTDTLMLSSLSGRSIEQIHTRYGDPHDVLTLVLDDGRRLEVPVDWVIPVGSQEWDDYWTDFDDFVEEGPDDLEPEAIEGQVVTLGELMGRRIVSVRTGQGSAHGRFVMLDLEGDLGLLMPAGGARLGKEALALAADFDQRHDEDVSRYIAEEEDL